MELNQGRAAAHVYCGCTIATGSMFDDRECGWEGDVPISEDPEDRQFDTFDCPECGVTGLLVSDHSTDDAQRPAFAASS